MLQLKLFVELFIVTFIIQIYFHLCIASVEIKDDFFAAGTLRISRGLPYWPQLCTPGLDACCGRLRLAELQGDNG